MLVIHFHRAWVPNTQGHFPHLCSLGHRAGVHPDPLTSVIEMDSSILPLRHFFRAAIAGPHSPFLTALCL